MWRYCVVRRRVIKMCMDCLDSPKYSKVCQYCLSRLVAADRQDPAPLWMRAMLQLELKNFKAATSDLERLDALLPVIILLGIEWHCIVLIVFVDTSLHLTDLM